MKKIFNILLIFTLCFAISSCGDDDYTEKPLSTIDSVKEFLPEGGVQKVQLSTSGASVVSDQAWCKATVSGDMLTVEAQVNGESDGRTAKLSVKSGDHTTLVMVHQQGAVLWIKGLDMSSKRILLSTEGGKREGVTINSSLPVEIKPSASWIKYTYVDGKLTITADKVTVQQPRQGTITIKSGDREEVFTVRQTSYKALLGEWSISLSASNGKPVTGKAVLAIDSEKDETYLMSFPTMIVPYLVFYDAATGNLEIGGGYELDMDEDDYIVSVMISDAGNVIANYGIVAEPKFGEKVEYSFADVGAWPGKKINRFGYGAYDAQFKYLGLYRYYFSDVVLSR